MKKGSVILKSLKNKKETEQKKEDKTKAKKVLGFLSKTITIFLKSFLWVLGSFLLLGVIFATSTYARYANDFKSLSPKNNSTKNFFFDKNGEVIYESFGAAPSKEIKLSDIPPQVKNAALASEDAEFYNHGAIDFRGILRATVVNLRSSQKEGLGKISDLFSETEYSQGGSTITQQLVKNLYLTNERSFERKLREVVYAYELEKKYTKDEILEMYLNNVYFGEQSLGIVNASKVYYQKDIDDLSLGEVSMIIGLPAAPTRLSPVSGDFDGAKERQKYVLSQMYLSGMITLDEAQEAAKETLYFSSEREDVIMKYPYFVDFVKEELRQKLGTDVYDAGGLKVYTTLDPKIQIAAEEAAAKHIATLKNRNVTNAAVVVMDNPTGEIRAMVGGLDYDKSKVNVTTAKRQPGSSFKPIVYTAGLLEDYTAASRFWDGRVNFGGIPPYIPRNYDGGYRGYVTMRTALSNSLNVPAVEMTKLVGVKDVLKTAETLGIKSLDQKGNYGLSIGLGSGEVKLLDMVGAYSTLANQGIRPNVTVVDKIVDPYGNEIYLQPELKEQAVDPKVAYIMTSILSDNNSRRLVFGTNSLLQLGNRPVAAKTGTTDSFADNWTLGYTPQYTVGVWVGNNDRSVMRNLPGLQGAAPIWNSIMKNIHQGLEALPFEKPAGLEEAWINPATGLPATYKNKPNLLEYFLPGTVPTKDQKFDYLKQFR